jgi:hypothetical protein
MSDGKIQNASLANTINLVALGFAATTNPMGVNKWRSDYNQALRGRNVRALCFLIEEAAEHISLHSWRSNPFYSRRSGYWSINGLRRSGRPEK